MNVLNSLKWRYATKSFDSTKLVPDAKLHTLKEAFNLTATSYGLQPVKMVILKNKEIQKELVAHSFNQKQVEQASHILVLCIETKIDKSYIESYFKNIKEKRGTPDEVLNPFKEFLIEDFSKKTLDEIKHWATKQAYITLGNLLTVCALEEIDACPMEGFLVSEYDRVLGLEKLGLQSVLVLPIGYRSNDDMFANFSKVRKNLEESVIEL